MNVISKEESCANMAADERDLERRELRQHGAAKECRPYNSTFPQKEHVLK